jgi:hypothetical protein
MPSKIGHTTNTLMSICMSSETLTSLAGFIEEAAPDTIRTDLCVLDAHRLQVDETFLWSGSSDATDARRTY